MRRLTDLELDQMATSPGEGDVTALRQQLAWLAGLLSRAAPYLAAAPTDALREMTSEALAHLQDTSALARPLTPGSQADSARALQRLRALLATLHPHLDASIAPDELQDDLAAEVREIAADRLARAARDRGPNAG